jgi:hypothetical protein
MTEIERKVSLLQRQMVKKWKFTITRRKLFFVSQTGMFSAQKKYKDDKYQELAGNKIKSKDLYRRISLGLCI